MGIRLLTTIIYTSGHRCSQVNPDASDSFPECLFLLLGRSSRRAAWPQHGGINEGHQVERVEGAVEFITGVNPPSDTAPASRRPNSSGRSPFPMQSLFQRVVKSGPSAFSPD